MNYIIPNERLKKLMTDYLNRFKNECRVSKLDGFISLSKKLRNNLIFYSVLVEYDSSDGRLLIDRDVLDNFMSWFPIYPDDAEDFIKDWFENTFDVKVFYTRVS